MDRTLPPEPACNRHAFHPLEIFPVFRRIPYSAARDLAYTFIWNTMFGVAFYFVAALFSSRFPGVRVLGVSLLLANLIGYAIHGLYVLGAWSGLEARFTGRGFAGRTLYFALIPLVGVAAGYGAGSLVVDFSVRGFIRHAPPLLTMLSVGLAISVVLSVIFFWRERSALAEAELARERERVERIERSAATANLRALQAQIEPHFLFNTLANVAGLIDPDPARAKGMLESFIRFLRASLQATRAEQTTLGEDGQLIAAYLDVLQVRMGERLRYRVEIPAPLAGFALPPMLLQPVVENAIRHGLEPKVEGGEVTVRACREGDQVAIAVADTGVGFGDTTRGGTGLANLRERLKGLYGERASLQVAQNGPSGTVVTLRVPG